MNFLTKFIASTIAMLSPCSAFTVNANPVSIEDMKNYLLDIGVPEVYVEYYSDEKIESTYQEFQGKNIVNGGYETSYLTIEEDIQPLSGAIKESDMKLTTSTLIEYYNADTKQIANIKIYIAYEWLRLPMWKKTDAVIVNWDSDIFTYQSGSFDSNDFANTKSPKGDHYEIVKVHHTSPTEIVQGGLGYLIKFPEHPINLTYALFGGAEFNLLPTSNPMYIATDLSTPYRTTSVNIQYRHDGSPFGTMGLNVKGVSISFDKDALTYTTAQALNLIYKY